MTGKELRRLRSTIGVSQAGLAKAMDLSVRTVSRWETGEGKIPRPMAKALTLMAPMIKELAEAKVKRKG